jgi:hypothetical protein
MQIRDRSGNSNPIFGKLKSYSTLAKLTKLVYVYNCLDLSLIGEFSTINCSKYFKLGKDTLNKLKTVYLIKVNYYYLTEKIKILLKF